MCLTWCPPGFCQTLPLRLKAVSLGLVASILAAHLLLSSALPLVQVSKVNAFTVSGVDRAKKRLKGLQERVRANKDGRDTEELLQVSSVTLC